MYNEELNFKKLIKKRSFILFTVILILSAIICSWINLKKGLYLDNTFLYKLSDNLYKNGHSFIKVEQNKNVYNYTFSLEGNEKKATMTLDSISSKKKKVTIKVYNNTDSAYDKTYEGYYITDTNSLMYEDGSPMAIPYNDSIEFNTGDVTTHDTFPLSNNDLLNTISSVTLCEQLTKQGRIIDVIIYVVVYIIFMLAFFVPNKIFFLFTSWLYEEPNLSETGIKVVKGASVALLFNAMLFFIIK